MLVGGLSVGRNQSGSELKIVFIVSEDISNFTVNIGDNDILRFLLEFQKEVISEINHLIHNLRSLLGNFSDQLSSKLSQFSVDVVQKIESRLFQFLESWRKEIKESVD